jgi:hypothetical protein
MSGPYNGFMGGFDQPGSWGRNDSGNFFIRRIHGDKTSLTLLGNQIAEVLGLTYEVIEGHLTSTLEIHYPWNYTANNAATDKVVKWELFAAGSEKDLLEAQAEVPAILGSLSQQQIAQIRQYIMTPPTITKTMPSPTADDPNATAPREVLAPVTIADFNNLPPDANGNPGNAANALAVYQLMTQGVRSYPIDQPILRRTIITNQNYAVAMALHNVRKIISTTSLVSLEQVDTDSLFYDPTNGQLLLPDDVSPTPALAFGWYKGFPTVQELALLKWSIVQEWKYGLWATLIWGTPL